MDGIAARVRPPHRAAVWAGRAYAAIAMAVLSLRFGLGDTRPFLFAMNALLLYVFLPAPVVLVAGVMTRRKELIATAAVTAGAWAWLWGGLFVPRGPRAMPGAAIRVLSYNALGYNRDASDTVRILRKSDADLVALQELNPETAAAIDQGLAAAYPYRRFAPREGVAGAGMLSRLPMRPLEPQPLRGLSWVGRPLVTEVSLGDTAISVVAFHAFAGPEDLRQRDRQARALADLARHRRGPLILLGDLNATDQNDAYRIIAREARDAWREVGFGFGHTFPGPPTPSVGGSRPVAFGVPVPLWLVRIDYIFHTDELAAVDARLVPEYGRSDHRGVLATLALREASSTAARPSWPVSPPEAFGQLER